MYADNLGAAPSLQSLDGIDWKLTGALTYRELVDDLYSLVQQFTSPDTVASLSVLKDICTLVVSRDGDLNNPLKPNYIFNGRRSAALEDFASDNILGFLSDAFNALTRSSLLKARIGECLWHLKTTGRDIENIRAAIDGYSAFPIEDNERWLFDGEPLLERAIRLSKSIGGGAEDRLARLEDRLCSTLLIGELAHEPHWLADISTILLTHRLGGDYHQQFAGQFEEWAKDCEQEQDFLCAQSYYDHSIRWLATDKRNDINDQVALLGDCHYRAGEHFRDSGELGLTMRAAAEFERAINNYRSLTGQYKNNNNIQNEITSAQLEIRRLNIDVQQYMQRPVERPECWRKMKQLAIAQTEHNTPQFALRGLSEMTTHFRYDENRVEDIRTFGRFPFSAMSESVHLSVDGRVEARQAGVDALGTTFDENNDDHKAWIEHEVFTSYQNSIEFITRWMIFPALNRIRRRHRIAERYFQAMVSRSTFVSHHRVRHVAKGLSIGYGGELSQAMHLLAPQLEGTIREHLQECIAITAYTADADKNITREGALGAIMDNHSELCAKLYGNDLAYQIRHLFCNNAGPNVRNETAHGFLTDYDDRNIYYVYAWCLILRLVFLDFSIPDRDLTLTE